MNDQLKDIKKDFKEKFPLFVQKPQNNTKQFTQLESYLRVIVKPFSTLSIK